MNESQETQPKPEAGLPLGAAPCSANGVITEMALCEVPHVFLRPGQLYRFVVMPGCKACEDAAAPYSPNTGSHQPSEPEASEG